MAAVAPLSLVAPADPRGWDETIRALPQRLCDLHGVSVLSAEAVVGGIELQLTAHSVQAADFAEHALGGLGIGEVWGECDGVLILRIVLRRNV